MITYAAVTISAIGFASVVLLGGIPLTIGAVHSRLKSMRIRTPSIEVQADFWPPQHPVGSTRGVPVKANDGAEGD